MLMSCHVLNVWSFKSLPSKHTTSKQRRVLSGYVLIQSLSFRGYTRAWTYISGADSDYRKIRIILDKIGKPGNFEDVHFIPVSAPAYGRNSHAS